MAVAPWNYDFGTSTSPLAPGYNRVTRSTLYSPGSYGWTNITNMEDMDRGTPADSLQRDFCFYNTYIYGNQAKIFRIDIANGDYLVEYMMGDADYAHDYMNIKANGITKASGINTAIGQFITGSFYVTVTAGNLQLEFSDSGGPDPCWVINSIVIRPNIAPLATVTTSSTYPGYSPYGAVDGFVDGYPNDISKEWTSFGEKDGAWLELDWSTARPIRTVVLYDRINSADQVWAFSLTWSGFADGYLELPDNGTGFEITPGVIRTSTWLNFTVDQASPTTSNVGLAEIEVYE